MSQRNTLKYDLTRYRNGHVIHGYVTNLWNNGDDWLCCMCAYEILPMSWLLRFYALLHRNTNTHSMLSVYWKLIHKHGATHAHAHNAHMYTQSSIHTHTRFRSTFRISAVATPTKCASANFFVQLKREENVVNAALLYSFRKFNWIPLCCIEEFGILLNLFSNFFPMITAVLVFSRAKKPIYTSDIVHGGNRRCRWTVGQMCTFACVCVCVCTMLHTWFVLFDGFVCEKLQFGCMCVWQRNEMKFTKKRGNCSVITRSHCACITCKRNEETNLCCCFISQRRIVRWIFFNLNYYLILLSYSIPIYLLEIRFISFFSISFIISLYNNWIVVVVLLHSFSFSFLIILECYFCSSNNFTCSAKR